MRDQQPPDLAHAPLENGARIATASTPNTTPNDGGGFDATLALLAQWKLLLFVPLLVGCAALAITYAIAPTFTASSTFIPPQQAQSAAASALASLGSLASLAGGAGATARSSGDQYVALMQSATVADRIIDQFKLMQVYDVDYRVDARRKLERNVRIAFNRKDGLITAEVDDESPNRAAEIANRFVEELRRLTAGLAVTEAQQRRMFFEQQLKQTRDHLVQAQQALQESGFSPGALKAEPKAAADSFAKLLAEATAAEVRLQTLRSSLTESAPEVQNQRAALAALRSQLAQTEQTGDGRRGPDYVGRYREYKYQEILFELYARQFELARVDESREGALIQVVDRALPPEKKSKPKRAVIAVTATLLTAVALVVIVLVRHSSRRTRADGRGA